MTPLQASKWLKCQMLLDIDEMHNLLETLGEFSIFLTGCVCRCGEECLSKNQFLEKYRTYVESLLGGKVPDLTEYRPYFSSIFTLENEAIFSISVSENKHIIRVSRPVIQLQAHNVHYSAVDGKFHPMVFGNDTIMWGIQFSYPQLYLDPESRKVVSMMKSSSPNTELFRKLQRWMRKNTTPTPFFVNGHVINVPMRLGKQCLSKIDNHPQLKQKEITVKS